MLPIPYPDAVPAVYGQFQYTSNPDGSIRYIDDAWPRLHISAGRTSWGVNVWVNVRILDEVLALLEKAALPEEARPQIVRGYVPKHLNWNPTKPLSLQAWGAALEIDPGRRPSIALEQAFREAGWRCGGVTEPWLFERVRS